MSNMSWATKELERWFLNDEYMYLRMRRILAEEINPYTAARRLREEFSDFESKGEPIGKTADYLQIVHSQTSPDDWTDDENALWRGVNDAE